MTEVVDMDTFYKAAGGSTTITAKFSAIRFQNPVTVTTSKLLTEAGLPRSTYMEIVK